METNSFKKYQDKVKYSVNEYDQLRKKLGISDKGCQESIKRKSEPFIKGYFTLAVVGKMSAGKSTFINALLKDCDILPSGHTQTTCVLTEIIHSDHKKIVVTYGDNSIKTNEDKKSSLKHIVAIPEKYKELPINHINELILSDKKENEIISLIPQLSEIADRDINKNLLVEYLKEHPKSKIVKKVVLYYPLSDEFNGWRIVDTPGVEAIGGVEDCTKDFLCGRENGKNNVDAIIFVHSAKDNIEDKSINSFVKSTFESLTDEAKKRTFFVLTHATDRDIINRADSIKDMAISIFARSENGINKERILFVDSLISLLYDCSIAGGLDPMVFLERTIPKDFTQDEFFQFRNIINSLADQLEIKEKKEVNTETLTKKIFEVAGFENLNQLLNKFAQDEKLNAYNDIIKLIKNDIDSFSKIIAENKLLFENRKYKSEADFKKIIDKKKEELDEIRVKQNELFQRIGIKYSKNYIDSRFEPYIIVFKNKISSYKAENFAKMQESIMNIVQNSFEKINIEKESVFSDLVKEFKRCSEEITLSFPNISLSNIDFEFLAQDAEEKSIEVKTRMVKDGGFWGGIKRFFGTGGYKKETYNEKNNEKKVSEFKHGVINAFTESMQKYKAHIISSADQMGKDVSLELKTITQKRSDEYHFLCGQNEHAKNCDENEIAQLDKKLAELSNAKNRVIKEATL